ncbi:efflux RND transporter periplasmic adaptor subunit [Desulfoluna spongiiphila]|uniref:RND family efflux transporter, MFP subunit n=1 Tax=Desulfoluna spongiiphila TaxID=419481 RepID=A0A1G5EH01_9BACT|nr:efflux RND transporter periplasmic adaptor subunit [Desulfoluna spongiiphila]SCY26262.1 RND family efflux transporter, MFP subunit [Desulfoluna spongiiphila]
MMKRRGKINIRAAVLPMMVLLLALALTGCSESEANRMKENALIRPIKAVTLSRSGENASWRFPGAVRSLRDVELSFRVGGPVVALAVDRGEKVRKGEVVARIDPRDFEVAVATLSANLAVSRAQLKEAALQYKRYKTLSAESAAAQATFDSIIATYEVAKASVDAAEKRLEEAKNSLDDTVLIAPFDGYVHEKFIDNHETVAQGQPVISLVDLDHMEVEVSIPEGMLPIVRQIGAIVCRFDALPGETLAATVKELSKNPNPSNRSYPLYLTLDGNRDHRIRPGMASEVTLTALNREVGFCVPETAVVNTVQEGTFVWVVDEKEMAARQVTVELLGASVSGLRIDGPLEEGMQVIAAGARGLTNGRKVKVMPEASPTNVGGEL